MIKWPDPALLFRKRNKPAVVVESNICSAGSAQPEKLLQGYIDEITATRVTNPIAWTRLCAVLLILFGLVNMVLTSSSKPILRREKSGM